jgi:hypothetical protein
MTIHYFKGAATIRHVLEVLLKEMRVKRDKAKEERE